MAYNNGKISAPVSIYDVQRALGNASSDLATLCEDANINPWARWKPIAANPLSEFNKPGLLTLDDVQKQNYGSMLIFDTWSFDQQDQIEEWANSGGGGVKCRQWNHPSNQWHRLADFVSPDRRGGYDHNAQPSTVTIQLNSTDSYTLSPLIPPARRTMTISEDTKNLYRFEFPRDYHWLYEYFSEKTPKSVLTSNDDWMTPLDFMAGDTYGNGLLMKDWKSQSASLSFQNKAPLRGVHLLSRGEGGNGKWVFRKTIWDGTTGDPGAAARPYNDQNKGAYLNFADGDTEISTIEGKKTLGTITGEWMVVEFYRATSTGGTSGLFPIPGFTYTINIERGEYGFVTVDTDSLTFVRAEAGNEAIIITTYHSFSTSLLDYLKSTYSELMATYNGKSVNLLAGNSNEMAIGDRTSIYQEGSYQGWYEEFIYISAEDVEQSTHGSVKLSGKKNGRNVQTTLTF